MATAVNFDPSTAKPVIEFDPSTAKVVQNTTSVSPISQAFSPIKEIPSDIASEFKQGAKAVSEGLPTDKSFGNPIKTAFGGLQEIFSPITGTAKALVTDPIKAQFKPGSLEGEFISNMAGDAATMFGPAAVSKSLSSVSKLLPKYNDAVKKLMAEGVRLTPGDIARSFFKRGEDAVRSLPGLGQVIEAAQARSLKDFNRVVLNRSLKQVGESLPKTVQDGRQAIDYVGGVISGKYDKLLPKMKFMPDKQLLSDVLQLNQQVRTLPSERAKQVDTIINDAIGRLNSGTHNGYTFKEVESELSGLARGYMKSPDADQHAIGQILYQFTGLLRQSLERSNPQYASQLQKLNSAWSVYKLAQMASIQRVASNGVFSPADLLMQIKRLGPNAFSRGKGLLQDLADAANEVLPQTVPNSGTAARVFWGELATGGVLGIGHPLGPMTMPALAGVGTIAGAYSPAGMSAINAAARGVPRITSATRSALERILPPVGPTAAVTQQATQ